jgi:hypothetical protein
LNNFAVSLIHLIHSRCCHGRDHMVVGFITTCAISAYRQ